MSRLKQKRRVQRGPQVFGWSHGRLTVPGTHLGGAQERAGRLERGVDPDGARLQLSAWV